MLFCRNGSKNEKVESKRRSFDEGNKRQKITFKKKLGRARGKSFVTRVGLGGVFETFRLDSTEFTIETEAIGGATAIDFERFLAGQEDLAEQVDIRRADMGQIGISRRCGCALLDKYLHRAACRWFKRFHIIQGIVDIAESVLPRASQRRIISKRHYGISGGVDKYCIYLSGIVLHAFH